MRSYDPLYNVPPRLPTPFPAFSITAYRDDDRVALDDIARFVRLLRTADVNSGSSSSGGVLVTLNVDDGDHFAGESLAQAAREAAFLRALVLLHSEHDASLSKQ